MQGKHLVMQTTSMLLLPLPSPFSHPLLASLTIPLSLPLIPLSYSFLSPLSTLTPSPTSTLYLPVVAASSYPTFLPSPSPPLLYPLPPPHPPLPSTPSSPPLINDQFFIAEKWLKLICLYHTKKQYQTAYNCTNRHNSFKCFDVNVFVCQSLKL